MAQKYVELDNLEGGDDEDRKNFSHRKIDAHQFGISGQVPRGKDQLATIKGARPLPGQYQSNICQVDFCNQVATNICNGSSGLWKGCNRKMCVLHTLRRGKEAASSDCCYTAEACLAKHTCCKRFEMILIILSVLAILAALGYGVYKLVTA